MISKASLVFKCMVLSSALNRTFEEGKGIGSIHCHWHNIMVVALMGSRLLSSMSLKHLVDVCFTRELEVVSGLMEIDAIVASGDTLGSYNTSAFARSHHMVVDDGD
jgi:hypothetical protein